MDGAAAWTGRRTHRAARHRVEGRGRLQIDDGPKLEISRVNTCHATGGAESDHQPVAVDSLSATERVGLVVAPAWHLVEQDRAKVGHRSRGQVDHDHLV